MSKKKKEISPKCESKAITAQLVDRPLPEKCPLFCTENEGKLGFEVTSKDILGTNVMQYLTGTKDPQLFGSITQSGIFALPSMSQDTKHNVAYQALAEAEPKDATEAKLILQAHALYSQGMLYLERAEKTDRVDHLNLYMNTATKLLRLHNETIEALNRYRRRGEQRVVVQHVNVNDGGKAVVSGSMIPPGGG